MTFFNATYGRDSFVRGSAEMSIIFKIAKIFLFYAKSIAYFKNTLFFCTTRYLLSSPLCYQIIITMSYSFLQYLEVNSMQEKMKSMASKEFFQKPLVEQMGTLKSGLWKTSLEHGGGLISNLHSTHTYPHTLPNPKSRKSYFWFNFLKRHFLQYPETIN